MTKGCLTIARLFLNQIVPTDSDSLDTRSVAKNTKLSLRICSNASRKNNNSKSSFSSSNVTKRRENRNSSRSSAEFGRRSDAGWRKMRASIAPTFVYRVASLSRPITHDARQHSLMDMTAQRTNVLRENLRCVSFSLMSSRASSVSASPFGSTATAVCCESLTSNSSPADDGRGSFFRACSYHGSLRRLPPATGRVRLTVPENANSCSCASSTCAIASESRRIAFGTWTKQLCTSFQQATAGGPRRPSQPTSSPRAPSSRSCLLQTWEAACGQKLSMRERATEYTLMDHSFRASSCPTLRRTGSRTTLSWT